MAENKNPMELLAERDKIFQDFYTNVTPERMPVSASVTPGVAAGYADMDPFAWHYDGMSLFPAFEMIADKLYSDTCPFSPPVMMMRPSTPYQLLGSQSFVQAANGLVQHPEVIGMTADEYPELIERGIDYLMEKVMARQFKNLDTSDPVKMAYVIQMENNERNNEFASFFPAFFGFCARHGYHNGGTLGAGGFAEAPFDFLADQLRSFSQISVDVRRRRSQVAEAVEVLTPIMWKMGRPAYVDYQTNVFYPLHMPTYMREKDFMELYMPSFKKIMEQDAAHGIRSLPFLEDDWTRYLDIVHDEFPAGCILHIDEGDPKLFKEKLGKKFLIASMFPIEHTRLEIPQMLDKAKEFLDIMLPGCGYLFGFNKNALVAQDLPLEKYAALMEFVRDYSHYDNAGEPFGTPLNAEGFQPDPAFDAPLKSRIMFNWDEYKKAYPYAPEASRAKLEIANAQTFSWYINLLV